MTQRHVGSLHLLHLLARKEMSLHVTKSRVNSATYITLFAKRYQKHVLRQKIWMTATTVFLAVHGTPILHPASLVHLSIFTSWIRMDATKLLWMVIAINLTCSSKSCLKPIHPENAPVLMMSRTIQDLFQWEETTALLLKHRNLLLHLHHRL